jgi:SAM-dependent methyltransferase
MTGVCAACGGHSLHTAFRVAAGAGTQEMTPSTSRFGSALSDIVRCSNCGHLQLAQLPAGPSLVSDYAQAASDDYLSEEAGQRTTARGLLERLERHRSPGQLLDVGCWLGFLLDEARLRGWDVVGLEPSRYASEHARQRLGLDVDRTDLFSADLPDGAFDAIVLADVIEHLPDPGVALDRLAALLRPQGVLLLVLPDAGSRVAWLLGARWWSVIPTHVQYFTRRSLAGLLERRGWQILDVSTAPKAFSVRYYLERIGGYSPTLSRGLVRLAAGAGLAERMWAPDFRDRMAVLARAPGHNGADGST